MATTLTIPARDLRPGDIVVDKHGDREHAVFDVAAPGIPRRIRIWTADSDQRLGWPVSFDVWNFDKFTVIRPS